jgi:arginase family enzyme
MDVCLIDVPSTIGDARHGASTGAARLLASGAADRAAAGGGSVTVERVERVGPFGDSASSSADVNARLARAVSRTIAGGRLPVVLAGSCDACLGTLAGFDHTSCGVVWFDAHRTSTPRSTTSRGTSTRSTSTSTSTPSTRRLRQLDDALVSVTGRFRLRAAAVTTFDPERDPDGRTLRAALRIVELFAGAPAPTP